MTSSLAIGDVHGCDNLLKSALNKACQTDASQIILLGDYIDRGPASCAVIESLIALTGSDRVICLKGNHEAMMVEALRGEDELGRELALRRWLENGGGRTLRSYGVTDVTDTQLARVPAAHLDWLSALPFIHHDHHRTYVHAGLAPHRPLADQDEGACLWIRDAFLSAAPADLPAAHVVHGHTPHRQPELLPHRTNLDTGAYATGVLTIGVFDSDVPGGPVEVWPVV